ncbi:MAG: Inner rane transport permease ybhR [Bacteroidota bacterium]|jgi:ABC-2 type transport system permease protein
MKQLITFIKKEFFHVFRDRKTLLLLFGMPLAQILLFGFALTNEIKNSKMVILDQSKDEYSKKLIEKIASTDNFIISNYLDDAKQIEQEFKKGKVRIALVIPEKFKESLFHESEVGIQVITDASDPNTANTLVNYIRAVCMNFQKDLNKPMEIPYTIETQTRMIYNPELKGITNFVPGVISMVLLLISVLMTSISIVREKEVGTMEVLLVSPFNPFLVIISKLVPYFLLSILNLTLILILSINLMGMPMNGSMVLLYLTSSLFIITALSLGLLISTSTNSQQAAMLFSLMGMLIPSLIFTGFMFPVENMPLPLQIISNIVPSKWFYIIVKSIMIKGLGITGILKEIGILVLMNLVILTISLRKFKIRLE